jgi:uncharacterized protein
LKQAVKEENMNNQTVSLEIVDEFLAQKRIALVGISREPKDFSVTLFEELCRRGYDVVPVNPNTAEVLGRRCYARVQDIRPPVEAALLMTSPTVTDSVVKDCAEAGIRRVWMYRAAGKGAVSPEAVQFCREYKDCDGSGAVSVHVLARRRNWASSAQVRSKDHWQLSSSGSRCGMTDQRKFRPVAQNA